MTRKYTTPEQLYFALAALRLPETDHGPCCRGMSTLVGFCHSWGCYQAFPENLEVSQYPGAPSTNSPAVLMLNVEIPVELLKSFPREVLKTLRSISSKVDIVNTPKHLPAGYKNAISYRYKLKELDR